VPGQASAVGAAIRPGWVKLTGPERISRCGAPYFDAVPFSQELTERAPDRVLWGTDWPHPSLIVMQSGSDLVDVIPLYTANPVNQGFLLMDNPVHRFEFDGTLAARS
jgi:predicted TIM-barrel fold metal-dependent hydrolase